MRIRRADPILKVPDGYADSAVARGRPHRGTCDVRARVPGLANSSSLPAPHTQTCCLRWTLRPGCGRRPGEPDLLAGPGPCGDCLNGQSSPPCCCRRHWMSMTRSAGSSDGRCRFPTSAARAFSPVQFRAHRIHRRNLTDSVGVGRSASAQSGSPSNRSRQATVACGRRSLLQVRCG